MSNNQDINIDAQTADDQDVEGHGRVSRFGDDTMEDALNPRGWRRSDEPDGDDDVEGHAKVFRSSDAAAADAFGPQGIHRK